MTMARLTSGPWKKRENKVEPTLRQPWDNPLAVLDNCGTKLRQPSDNPEGSMRECGTTLENPGTKIRTTWNDPGTNMGTTRDDPGTKMGQPWDKFVTTRTQPRTIRPIGSSTFALSEKSLTPNCISVSYPGMTVSKYRGEISPDKVFKIDGEQFVDDILSLFQAYFLSLYYSVFLTLF